MIAPIRHRGDRMGILTGLHRRRYSRSTRPSPIPSWCWRPTSSGTGPAALAAIADGDLALTPARIPAAYTVFLGGETSRPAKFWYVFL